MCWTLVQAPLICASSARTSGPSGRPEWGNLLPYLLLFAYFAAGALLSEDTKESTCEASPILILGMFALTLMVGLRFKVGGDWDTYKDMFLHAQYGQLSRLLTFGDPGYQFLNWAVQHMGFGIWLVNLTCAVIFSWGLMRFARAQPSTWLSILVAIPYLVIVVAMGYTRQSVAIGILMAGLAAVHRGASVLRFGVYVAAAALFHKTAIVALPLVVFSSERSKFLSVLAGLALMYVFYNSFLAGSVNGYVKSYVDARYASQGAGVRVAMNTVAGTIFIIFRRRLGFSDRERRLWFIHSAAAFAMLVLLWVLPSSTAVDRLSLYLMPMQIAVLTRIQNLLGARTAAVLVVLYSLAVLLVWVNYAVHAKYWLPYRIYPLL